MVCKGKRPHIGIFGRRNVGKSAFINSISRQHVAIVADTPGTTTDPVRKAIEIPGIGPVLFIDTAGVDDIGELGKMRVNRTMRAIRHIDMAILIVAHNRFDSWEKELIVQFTAYKVPWFLIHNKSDLEAPHMKELPVSCLPYNALAPDNRDAIVAAIRDLLPKTAYQHASLIGDILSYGDLVVLVTPIDAEAPEGRLILPQVQLIRDVLDNDCLALVVKERELDLLWRKVPCRPKLVVTDSQAFLKVDAVVPKDIMLTSFSIILARHKGPFDKYLEGTPRIDNLRDNDRVLILESCSHHVAADDIGRVKIPRWLSNYTGKNLQFDVVPGLNDYPRPVTDYQLVIQCGGCMVTPKQLTNRLQPALEANIPVSNYGMTIAYLHGIYQRAVAPFVAGLSGPPAYL